MSKAKQFIKMLEQRAGCKFSRIETTGGNHLRLRVDGCSKSFIVPFTTSDKRAVLNAAADVKRTLRMEGLIV